MPGPFEKAFRKILNLKKDRVLEEETLEPMQRLLKIVPHAELRDIIAFEKLSELDQTQIVDDLETKKAMKLLDKAELSQRLASLTTGFNQYNKIPEIPNDITRKPGKTTEELKLEIETKMAEEQGGKRADRLGKIKPEE